MSLLRRNPWLPFALAAVLILLALGLWIAAPDEGEAKNSALVDGKETSRIVDVVTSGLESVFAYDFRQPDANKSAVEGFFTGDAVGEYDDLRATVADLGEEQALVYKVTVEQVGVQEIEGDRATVLAFVHQESTRGSDGAVEEAPAQLVLDLTRSGDSWKVTDLKLL